jgi:hypothetical protein
MDNPEKLATYIGYTRRRKTKRTHNTICIEYHYTQTNTNNINKTWTLQQTTGSKDKPNIVLYEKRKVLTLQHGIQNVKTHNRTTQTTKKCATWTPPKNLEVNVDVREG